MEALAENRLDQISTAFDAFCTVAGFKATSDAENYEKIVELVDAILDETRPLPEKERENNPLHRLLDWLTPVLTQYENTHFQLPKAEPREILSFLMEQHNLTQSELPEVGNQSVVSQILSGKRELNTRQIVALSSRFGVDAGVFLRTA